MELRSSREVANVYLGKYLIAGLGNPGSEYRLNRHNLGFMVLDRISQRHDIKLTRLQRRALTGSGKIGDHSVILVKPQTFMNRSGDSVRSLVDYYNISLKNLLLIYDEIDLPLGTIRIREKGGSGGHRGMKSIISHLDQDFARVRLGVGRPIGRIEPADFVLQNFHQSEHAAVDEMIDLAATAVETYLSLGIDLAMTRYNRSDQDPR